MRFVIAGVIGLLILVLLARWFVNAPASTVVRSVRRGAIVAVIGGLVFLAATGRLHWLMAAFGAVLPLVFRFGPLLRRLLGRGAAARGLHGEVQTGFLRMSLDAETGELRGEVLAGRFQGRALQDLSLDELSSLYAEYRLRDPASAQLLEAYLDRKHGPQWREQTGTGDARSPDARVGDMSPEEACQVLGVGKNASREEVLAAHRRLIQKLHPDRGGSTYLAAKINQAKDVLAGK